ncbi:MAG TPA: GtrA family protein [Candidatus Saccharimonadales bacterium]|nr:GtrA family protein [Candidatus Saccharimonadales bacterium]
MLNPKSAKKGASPNIFKFGYRHFSEVLERDPSYKYHIQLIRSLIVSVIAVIVNFGGSYVLKDKLGLYYLLSAALSFFMGVLVNYYLSVKWVFATRKLNSKHIEFVVFVIITGVGLALNLAIIAAIVEATSLGYWAGLVVATVVVFFWNFLMRKKILY